MKYEFSDEDNDIITAVVTRLIIQGFLLTGVGLTGLLYIVINPTLPDITRIIFFIQSGCICITGIVFFLSPSNFMNVVTTKGNDIKELMSGFKSLSISFMVVWILFSVGLAINFFFLFT